MLVKKKFDFFKWEAERCNENEKKEKIDEDNAYYGGTKLRRKRAAIFKGDTLCEHVDPDPEFLGFEE